MHHSDAHLCIVENQKRAQLMGHLNTVWCEGGREAGREAYLFHECRHFCSDNGYLSPGQRKRGAWIKAALFKCQSTEKYPIMVHFESNKQTQKRYVTEWVKRNAVIKQELCLCGTYKRTISPDLFPSVPVREVPVMPLWTVNVVIVMLTAPFSKDGHKVRLVVLGDLLCGIWHIFGTIPTQSFVRNKLCNKCYLVRLFFIIIFHDCNKNLGFRKSSLFSPAMWEARLSWVITAVTAWLEFSPWK